MTAYVLDDGLGTTKPRNNRTFTIADLGYAFGVTSASILNEIHKNNLPFTVEKRGRGKRFIAPYETYLELKKHYDKMLEKKAGKKKVTDNAKPAAQKSLTVEEMRKLHPLVTDDRFFKESYFPETVPDCFEDMG